MTDENEIEKAPLVDELRELWARGASPSALLRHLQDGGKTGVHLIVRMQDAFALPLSKTKVINAWMSHGDDERLNRFLVLHMPDPDSPAFGFGGKG